MSRGGFLSRWARLKAETQAPREAEPAPLPEAEDAPQVPAPADEPAPDQPAEQGEEEPFDPSTLPDIDSLDAQSDYSAFMDARVPQEMRNRALRKLWTSDPVYAVRDGLNDYDEDFGAASLAGRAVSTIYDAVKGYHFPEDDAPEDQTQEAEAAQAQVEDEDLQKADAPPPERAEGNDENA